MARHRDLMIALEMLTEGADAALPRSIRTESLESASEALREKTHGWTMGPGIQGVGIGEKITERKKTQELVLKVYVKEKKPKSECRNPVPTQVRVPEIGALPTDVEEIGEVEVEVFRSRVRPAMPGCGLGHLGVTVGTFGCVVRKRSRDGALYVLSNSHVLANEGIAAIGDKIVQPGRADGGKLPGDVLGTLAEFVPFQFTSTGFPNLVDAAIAKVPKSRVIKQIRILGIQPAGVSRTVRRGMRVKKVGRTTDLTIGEVRDVNYRLALNYKKTPTRRGRAGLRDQVLCTRYTAGGDSGSAVLNTRNNIVGLHFAGSPSTSIFNKIRNVFRLLDIELA